MFTRASSRGWRAGFQQAAKRAFASKSGRAGKIPKFARTGLTGTALAATGIGMGKWWFTQEGDPKNPAKWSLDNNDPAPRPDLPTYTLADLKAHTSEETGYWVTYRGAVYDITSFIYAHPGSSGRLQMAAGNDLEPFWDVYRLHYRGHIVPFLEKKFRIGNLRQEDRAAAKNFKFGDYYENDPPRHYDNTPCTHKPYCGEARLDLLAESYFTPNELFYVRNHNAVPQVEPEDYELIIEGNGVKRTIFTYKDLQEKFAQHDVVSVVQCAGNRGEDFHGRGAGPSKATFLSPHWSAGAISNAKWSGPKIRDILKAAGMDVDGMANGTVHLANGQHLALWAYDVDEVGEEYGASMYMDKIVAHDGDAIIALKMNDKIIPPDHGYPARAIIPGHAGARQPKWIHKLEIIEKPYCVLQCLNFAPDVTFEDDLCSWPPKGMSDEYRAELVVQEMPVQSLICQPPQNSTLGVSTGTGVIDKVPLKGVAWSGGGSGIKRVDVSLNAGKNFTDSELYKPVVQKRRCEWGWTLFHKEMDLPEDVKEKLKKGEKVELELVSKAVDSSFNVQPENPEPYVNPRGTAVNHWYRVHVTLDPSLPVGTIINPLGKQAQDGFYANAPTGGKHLADMKEGGWDRGIKGETPRDWHNYMNKDDKIDWNYYRSLSSPPFYYKAKIVVGKPDYEKEDMMEKIGGEAGKHTD